MSCKKGRTNGMEEKQVAIRVTDLKNTTTAQAI